MRACIFNKTSRFLFIIISLSVLSFSCIDQYDKIDSSYRKIIVIDGQITNEPGPYEVKISTTAPFNGDSLIMNITDAQVIIHDDAGNSEQLSLGEYGSFFTSIDGIKGEIGRTYTLEIRLADGSIYRSNPEKMLPPVEIDSIYGMLTEYKGVNENGNEIVTQGYDVFVCLNDPPDTKNYYKWKWNGTYKIETYPEDFHTWNDGEWVPAPKECCSVCWVSEYMKNEINILHDRYFNGEYIDGHKIKFLPFGMRFNFEKYYIEIEQYSISKQAWSFWDRINKQITMGSIFDSPPASVSGNVYNINDKDEPVLGWFSVASVTKKACFIYSTELGMFDYYKADDCRNRANSSVVQPEFWNKN